MDIDRVRPAESLEGDLLDTIEVHRDGGDVAGEADPVAVRRDVDDLGDVCAVELQRVGAALALDDVRAVPRVPDKGVVPGAKKRRVVAAAAGHEVVAVATQQQVGAVAACDGVVARATIDRQADKGGEAVPSREGDGPPLSGPGPMLVQGWSGRHG